mgnify:CR=1 FL=1
MEGKVDQTLLFHVQAIKMNSKIRISTEEFLGKILAGERDFSNIELKQGTNLPHSHLYKATRDYLVNLGTELKQNPINLSHSSFGYVRFGQFYLPHAIAEGTCFTKSQFWCADLSHGDFRNARFREANLRRTNFKGGNLSKANLYEAELSGAVLIDTNLTGSNIDRANLHETNLSGANLTDTHLKESHLNGPLPNQAHFEYKQIKVETHKKVPHNLARIALENLRRKDSMSLGNIK